MTDRAKPLDLDALRRLATTYTPEDLHPKVGESERLRRLCEELGLDYQMLRPNRARS